MMKKAVLVLALLSCVEGANLRRSVLQMSLATDELPAQVAAPAAPAAPAEPAAAVGLAEPLPSQTAPEVPASVVADPVVVVAAAPVVAVTAPVAAAVPLLAVAVPSVAELSENQVWAAGVAKKTTDEALLTLFDVAAQLKAVTADRNNDPRAARAWRSCTSFHTSANPSTFPNSSHSVT